MFKPQTDRWPHWEGGDQFVGLCDVTSDRTLLRLDGVKERRFKASRLLSSQTIQIQSDQRQELLGAMFDPASNPLALPPSFMQVQPPLTLSVS